MQEMSVWSLVWEDHLEKEMATHSSIFAREIPWIEQLDGRQSMGSQKSWTRWHDLATKQHGVLTQGALVVKNPPSNAEDVGDAGSIPGLGRFFSPGKGNGNPLQYSCLENPVDRGAWRATVHGAAKSRTWLKQFSTHRHILIYLPILLFLSYRGQQNFSLMVKSNCQSLTSPQNCIGFDGAGGRGK